MRGLFDSIFKEYNQTQALYQQAAQNVLATKDKAADKIAVAQIAKLQALAPAVSSAPKSVPVVAARQPDYPPSYWYGVAGIAAAGLLAVWLVARK